MMMMNFFCGMVQQRKAFSLISSRDHYQESSSSRNLSRFFLDRPIHTLNQQRSRHGWRLVGRFLKFVPPDAQYCLAFFVLWFPYKTLYKLLSLHFKTPSSWIIVKKFIESNKTNYVTWNLKDVASSIEGITWSSVNYLGYLMNGTTSVKNYKIKRIFAWSIKYLKEWKHFCRQFPFYFDVFWFHFFLFCPHFCLLSYFEIKMHCEIIFLLNHN